MRGHRVYLGLGIERQYIFGTGLKVSEASSIKLSSSESWHLIFGWIHTVFDLFLQPESSWFKSKFGSFIQAELSWMLVFR